MNDTPRGTTEHRCHQCGATVHVAGYPGPDRHILCSVCINSIVGDRGPDPDRNPT